jgi:hypothetical protein
VSKKPRKVIKTNSESKQKGEQVNNWINSFAFLGNSFIFLDLGPSILFFFPPYLGVLVNYGW